MSSRRLIRCGLALLTASSTVGCKDDGDEITDPGAIALALNPTSASVAQGGNTTTTATLTRSGGFTGGVTLSVTGAPSGVTAAVSNIQTTGVVTTATVTVTVGAAVAAATYPLVVHGTGSGVTEATASFALTVTAAPAGSVNRTNFPGDVQLAVTDLPAGVTAAFVPNPATGNSSVLTLTVGAAVPTQLFSEGNRQQAAGNRLRAGRQLSVIVRGPEGPQSNLGACRNEICSIRLYAVQSGDS